MVSKQALQKSGTCGMQEIAEEDNGRIILLDTSAILTHTIGSDHWDFERIREEKRTIWTNLREMKALIRAYPTFGITEPILSEIYGKLAGVLGTWDQMLSKEAELFRNVLKKRMEETTPYLQGLGGYGEQVVNSLQMVERANRRRRVGSKSSLRKTLSGPDADLVVAATVLAMRYGRAAVMTTDCDIEWGRDLLYYRRDRFARKFPDLFGSESEYPGRVPAVYRKPSRGNSPYRETKIGARIKGI